MTDRVTLRDVAREAGVHASTVSRALNPDTRSVVSGETLDRIVATAERLGYRPDPLARGLRTNRTYTVGMVVPDLENPLFPPIVRGAEAVLGAEGYSLLVGNTDNDPVHTEAVIATLVARRVDGLILATAERDGDLISELAAQLPLVLVNRDSEDHQVPAIVGDDEIGVGLAVDHLVDLGHRAIGHVAGPSQLSTGAGRAEAFRARMSRHGLDGGRIVEATSFQLEPGRIGAAELFEAHPAVTAIVAGNDLIALGCYQAVRERGGEVGLDVSVTGYNDMPYVDLMEPALTAVAVPYREMGERAAAVLLSELGTTRGISLEPVRLRPTLKIRASTASPR